MDENIGGLEVRLQRMEEALAYDRAIISDLQAVSLLNIELLYI